MKDLMQVKVTKMFSGLQVFPSCSDLTHLKSSLETLAHSNQLHLVLVHDKFFYSSEHEEHIPVIMYSQNSWTLTQKRLATLTNYLPLATSVIF